MGFYRTRTLAIQDMGRCSKSQIKQQFLDCCQVSMNPHFNMLNIPLMPSKQ